MTKKQEQPLSISGDEKQKLDGRKLKELDGQTAAIILEPIQGEAGVVVPPEGYLVAARRIAPPVPSGSDSTE